MLKEPSQRGWPSCGLTLHGPHPPHDPLDAVVIHNGTARTSGQLPRIGGQLTCLGRLGDTVTVEEGREAAAVCALNALAVLHQALGSLDRVERGADRHGIRIVSSRLSRAARCGRRGEQGCWPMSSATLAVIHVRLSVWRPCPATAPSRSR